MAPGLRNEDYVAFLDESGEDGLEVVAGILIPARLLRGVERRWHDFVNDRVGGRSGLSEIKGRELLAGGGVSVRVQHRIQAEERVAMRAKDAGRRLYREALEHIAGITEVRVLSVGLATKYPVDVYRLWFWLAYAALVERPRAPRPRLPLTVIDGEDAAFRGAHDLIAYRFHRAFSRCQPYVGDGRQWFVGGSVHQDSALHPLVQMADLVAGAARHAIAGRRPHGAWYREHLCDRARALGREIDVSQHALVRLRALSPRDACGSGWRDACLVPGLG